MVGITCSVNFCAPIQTKKKSRNFFLEIVLSTLFVRNKNLLRTAKTIIMAVRVQFAPAILMTTEEKTKRFEKGQRVFVVPQDQDRSDPEYLHQHGDKILRRFAPSDYFSGTVVDHRREEGTYLVQPDDDE